MCISVTILWNEIQCIYESNISAKGTEKASK